MIAALVSLAFILAAGLWAFQKGPTPQRWLASLTSSLSQQWGVDVSIRSLSLAGWDRIALHDVRLEGSATVEARRVVAAFSVPQWLRHPMEPLSALRWVRMDDWHATVPESELAGAAFGGRSLEEWLTAEDFPFGIFSGAATGAGAADGGSEGSLAAKPSGRRESGELLKSLDSLVQHEWLDGTLDVYIQGGRITTSENTSLAFSVDGAAALGGGRLVLRNVRIGALYAGDGTALHRVVGAEATVNGAAWPRADLYVNGEIKGRDVFGQQFGSLAGEGWVAGAWSSPTAWGAVKIGDLVLPWGVDEGDVNGAGAAYTVEETIIQWSYRPGEPLQMTVDGVRGGARARLQGEISKDGELDFAVVATDVRIPEDVPPLRNDDVRGVLDVSGVLSGTWADPVLEADAASDGGYLFRQPVSRVQGRLRLSKSDLTFRAVRAMQGNSEYFLDGRLALDGTGSFELVLYTDRGRAETLLSVLNWDVPVQSQLAGTVRFARSAGPLLAAGDVTLERGSAWEQPFERVSGQFRYADGAFQVKDVVGTVRGGSLTASGGTGWSRETEALWRGAGLEPAAWDGFRPMKASTGEKGGPDRGRDEWVIHVEADEVPLQALVLWRERLPGVSGLLHFEGAVAGGTAGGASPPRVEGRVTAGHVAVGAVNFVAANGRIVWEGDSLSTSGVTLHRTNGGVYDVVGRITDLFDEPRLNLDIDVQDESVEALVALSDWRLPLLARSEPLQAKVTVGGTLAAPEAQLRITSDAMYIVGRPTPLALDLSWKDGRIEVESGVLQQGNLPPPGT